VIGSRSSPTYGYGCQPAHSDHWREIAASVTHLQSVSLKPLSGETANGFPFAVPAVRSLGTLALSAPVTFFAGENGSGKSTLLEGIAAAAGLPTVGSEHVRDDTTLTAQRALAARLKLVWSRRTHRGFFLRAEDFFGFTKYLAKLRADLEQRLADLAEEYRDRSAYAYAKAQEPIRASLGALEERYGVDLDANSHGQSFLRLFRSRFVSGGLYLLDEPEAPLSPQSQLALLAMLCEMTTQDAQFIIATHSPILLAFPGAMIYSFDQTPIIQIPYEELQHVTLTRDFLNAPERFLRHLR
jgi:predicted ATPase